MKRFSLNLLVGIAATAFGTMTVHAAAIPIQPATDITQTEATLTAEFPNASGQNQFQFKEGTLPTVGALSQCALTAWSDPVDITTSSSYGWRVRDVKGWVESAQNVSVGSSSVMTAKVHVYQPTAMTFEWSVDSEENFGILTFAVNSTAIKSISGYVSFTEETYNFTEAGDYTLTWTYKKVQAENVGLSVGMVRNITFNDILPNDWVSIAATANSATLTTLNQNKNYIFRATDGTNYSKILDFSTKPVLITDIKADRITQTTANISYVTDFGKVPVNSKLYVNTIKWANVPFSSSSDKIPLESTIAPEISGSNIRFGGVSTATVSSTFTLSQSSILKFTAKAGSYSNSRYWYLIVYVDGQYETSFSKQSKEISINLKAGEHTVEWRFSRYGSSGTCYAELGDINIKNVIYNKAPKANAVNSDLSYDAVSGTQTLNNLTTNTVYSYYFVVTDPAKEESSSSSSTDTGEIFKSETFSFTTLPILFTQNDVADIKQASATLSGAVDWGDATIVNMWVEYQESGANRWTSANLDVNKDVNTHLTRLKPGTTYYWRICALTNQEEAFTSESKTFRTLTVTALKPVAEEILQHSAKIKGQINFGDAQIYQRGWQYRKGTYGDWTELEDGGDAETFTAELKDLSMYSTYQVRTYVQPAGCDIQYSDILEFMTKTITLEKFEVTTTQQTAHVEAVLAPADIEISGLKAKLLDMGPQHDGADYAVLGEYPVSDNSLDIKDLTPNTDYNIAIYAQYDNEWHLIAEKKIHTADIAAEFNVVTTQTTAKCTIKLDSGDVTVSGLQYMFNGDWMTCTGAVTLTGLTPNSEYSIYFKANVDGTDYVWVKNFNFRTKSLVLSGSSNRQYQTSAFFEGGCNWGDADFVSLVVKVNGVPVTSGIKVSKGSYSGLLTELNINASNTIDVILTTEQGTTSIQRTVKTKALSLTTGDVSDISDRSARFSGIISCDQNSSAEFGFQWKAMTGWLSEPAFTKGVLNEDGTITVGLVNGMLDPNTDYQYRAAVRYKGEYYYNDNDWTTFRTESEFIMYPSTVYTMYRTDRENNCLVLCGYFIPGSEAIAQYGYEYRRVSSPGMMPFITKAASDWTVITTEENMRHTFEPGSLADGSYQVRAFVKTESGNISYGKTLGFSVNGNQFSAVEDITVDSDKAVLNIGKGRFTIHNCESLACQVYSADGRLQASADSLCEGQEFILNANTIYIVILSDGQQFKVKL